MLDDIGRFLVGLIIIAVVFVLVRSTNGASFVTAIGSAISSMLTAATGGGSSSASTSTGGTGTAAAATPSTTINNAATA